MIIGDVICLQGMAHEQDDRFKMSDTSPINGILLEYLNQFGMLELQVRTGECAFPVDMQPNPIAVFGDLIDELTEILWFSISGDEESLHVCPSPG